MLATELRAVLWLKEAEAATRLFALNGKPKPVRTRRKNEELGACILTPAGLAPGPSQAVTFSVR